MGTVGRVPKIKDGDWVSVRQAIAKLSTKLGPASYPTYAGVTLTGLTASRLIASDASKALESSDLASWVTGTANQVIVTDDADGTITLSTPQDIDATANPTFIGINLTTNTSLIQVDSGVFLANSGTENLRLGEGTSNGDVTDKNTFLGYRAGYNNDDSTPIAEATGKRNVYIGSRAGAGETGGSPNSGAENIAIGDLALVKNTTGYENTAVGDEALQFNTTGHGNVALGNDALQGTNSTPITGDFNTGIGTDAMYILTSGSYNTTCGYQNLFSLTTGDYNVAIGYQAGYSLTGSSNVFMGYKAGYHQTTITDRLIIDNLDRGSIANEETQALLYGIFDSDPDIQVLRVNGNVGFGTTSPEGRIHIAGTEATDIAIFDIGMDINPVALPVSPTITLLAEAGNIDAGVHFYYVTFVTALGETGMASTTPASITAISGTHEKVTVGIPVSPDYRVTARRVYRGSAGSASHLDNLLVATINNNTETEYEDNIADAGRTGSNAWYRENTTSKYLTIGGSTFAMAGYGSQEPSTIFGTQAGATIIAGTAVSGANCLFGYRAGDALTTGSKNNAFGFNALTTCTTSVDNIAIGWGALRNLSTGGGGNIAIGRNAGYYNATGYYNTLIGAYAGLGVTANSYDESTYIGYKSGFSNIAGDRNVSLGIYAGYYETGSDKLFIDNAIRANEADGRVKALIYGVFNAAVASQSLTVNGVILGSYGAKIGDGGTTDYVSIDSTGDVDFKGGSGLVSGSFWGNEISFVTAGGTGTYSIISDANITVGQTHNTTFQNNQELDIGAYAGMYQVTWSMSVKGTGASKHIIGAIGVDVGGVTGDVAQNDGRCHAITVGASELCLAGCAILDLSADDEVSLMVTNETDNTNVTVEHVNLVITQIGGT